ncbi:Wzz/FepE/Etk N-terminal domain-containing protein [Frankia sp. Cppng1_Ct_nod]|uniref:Wzz/FepE/Etk N-terminal domain-containing protein n=1 Tax=Frankia sp. Cppng1_Ct_nod TaxID=2897162 RepID=UPI001F5F8823|nr:Wzz/FepE/Etk N-terminal domain-containing protein [Frankia sp. Cppng1_Ct_nod]
MSPAAQPSPDRSVPGVSLLRVLGRRWLAIVITVIVGLAIGLILAKRQTPQFEATARVFLSTSDTALGGGSVDATRVVQTQAQFADSTAALDLIAKQLDVPRSYVAQRLKVTPSDEGYFFTILGRDSTEVKSVQLVQSTEAAYQQLLSQYGADNSGTAERLTRLRDTTAQNLQRLQAQVAASPRTEDPALASQISNLNAQIADLNRRIPEAQVNAALSAGSVTLAEAPRSDGQVGPHLFRNALVGALVGFFLAAAGVWCMYLRRPTVLDGRAAANTLNAPLIAKVPGGRGIDLPTETLVSAMAAVLSPTVKVVALAPAAPGDLGRDLVVAVAANWSDDQGVVLILDASPQPDVRAAVEQLPRPVSGELPRWAHEPTCLARSSGTGRGHLLYNRVAPARAARPGGLAPILADRAPVVDLVILLTPALSELPMTAASAMQSDAIIVVASGETPIRELAEVPRDWPVLCERIVGVVYDGRPPIRRSAAGGPGTGAGAGGAVAPTSGPVLAATRDRDAETQTTDRYVRPTGRH